MTDSTPDTESPTPPRRGLWAVMGQTVSPTEVVAEELPVAPVEDSPIVEPPPAEATVEETTSNVTAPGRRGLWSLMRSGDTPRVFDGRGADDPHAMPFAELQSVPPDASIPHSAVRAPHSPESPLTLSLSPEDGGEGTEEDDEEVGYLNEEEHLDEEAYIRPLASLPIDPDDLEPPRYKLAAAQGARQSWLGLASGVAAIAASALAMLPQVWASFPATVLGFVAIIGGYATLTGAARRELTIVTRAVSLFGIGLGTIGIFLGPLFFSRLGRELREATGQQATSRHLDQMGVALKRHHDQHSAFPVGGVFVREANGATKGHHGWMTFLLPFVGERELYLSINQDKPYDDLVNRVAMGRNVETYFAAGGDRVRIGQGFAVSHFAGVGGEIDDDAGLSHVGIFQRDEAVKREEVTDSVASTLIVGELAGTYPPWGDPENWRTIGRGLNKEVNGFGSASGNGATFLLGDGSVRFFNNKTDPKLLRKLSTRDGGEAVGSMQ